MIDEVDLLVETCSLLIVEEREKKGGWVATVQWCRERNWEDGTF